MGDTIYLDYATTTPVDPVTVEAMLRYIGPNDPRQSVFDESPAGIGSGQGGRRPTQAVGAPTEAVNSEVIWTSQPLDGFLSAHGNQEMRSPKQARKQQRQHRGKQNLGGLAHSSPLLRM